MLTGERTLPGLPAENYWFRRHEAAYDALVPFALGATVLEAGCGEGYGADRLARVATRVLAVDLDAGVAAHVGAAYPLAQVIRGDVQRLPLRDGSVEVVAALQVLEHLHDQDGFLRECARVLRPAGTLLLTTPNRLTFSPGSALSDRPRNPFHTRELAAADLRTLLERRFSVARLLGLRHGPALRRIERRVGPLVAGQLAAPPPRWSAALRGAVAAVRARDFVVSGVDVDRSLDLVAVAVRRP